MDIHNSLVHRWMLLKWKANSLPALQPAPPDNKKKYIKHKITIRLRIPAPQQQFYLGTGKFLER